MNDINKVFCFVLDGIALIVQRSVRRYIGLFFFLFFCVVPKNLYAQNINTDKKNIFTGIGHFLNGYDPMYIAKVKGNYTLALNNIGWFDSYSLFEEDTKLFFQSDLKYNIGPVIGYKSIVLSYSLNASDLFSGEKSMSKHWNFNLFSNRISLETSFLYNTGSTRIIKFKQSDKTTQLNAPFDGLDAENSSLNLLYYCNYKKYTNTANYSNGRNFEQLRSAGSLIFSGSYLIQNIKIDLSKLNVSNIQMDTDRFDVKSKIYCLGVGYGYNYLAKKNILLNLSVIPSIGWRYGNDNAKNFNGELSYNTKARLAFIYSYKKYLFGFTARHEDTYQFLDNYTYNSSLSTFSVFGCIHF